jgi:hypothetical protein
MKWWNPLFEFATHNIVGTGIFVIIFGAVIGLNYGVHGLEHLKIDTWIIYLAKGVEAIGAITDVVLYIAFLWVTGRKLINGL